MKWKRKISRALKRTINTPLDIFHIIVTSLRLDCLHQKNVETQTLLNINTFVSAATTSTKKKTAYHNFIFLL